MTLIRIRLTADDFRTLVTGGEVTFDDSDIVRSKGVELRPGSDDGVSIILEDMGWSQMADILQEVWPIWPIEPKELDDDKLGNFEDAPERKP